jgi:uncharacterized membrane protein
MNTVYLLICSLIPFGAELLGHYPGVPLCMMLYTVLLLALAGYRLFFYAYVTGCPEYLFAPLPHAREQTHGSRFQGSGIL